MAIINYILMPAGLSYYSESGCLFAERLAEATNGGVGPSHVRPETRLTNEQYRASAKNHQDVTDNVYPIIYNKAMQTLNVLSGKHIKHESQGDNYLMINRYPALAVVNQAAVRSFEVQDSYSGDQDTIFCANQFADILVAATRDRRKLSYILIGSYDEKMAPTPKRRSRQ